MLSINLCTDLTERDHYEMTELEKLYLNSDNIASPDVSIQWYKLDRLSMIAIKNEESKIVGHFVVLPITEGMRYKLYNGEGDTHMTDQDICTITEDAKYLYASVICIHKDYRNKQAFYLLLKEHLEVLNIYRLFGARLETVIVECTTTEGKATAKSLGFKETKINSPTSIIMEMSYEKYEERIINFIDKIESLYPRLIPDRFKERHQF